MTRVQVQSIREAADNSAAKPRQPEVYDLASTTDPPEQGMKAGHHGGGVIRRPSSVTGRAYEQVTAAYVAAVRSVLTGEKGAPEAAAALEKQLVQITGFHAGPPRREN
jgi:trehalose/maltose transport system substrate-binding protein